MIKPRLHLHPELNATLEGDYLPILYPYDPDHFFKGGLVSLEIYQQPLCDARILTHLCVSQLPDIPAFALQWTTGLSDIEEARLRYFRHYRQHHDLQTTLFSFSILEKLS